VTRLSYAKTPRFADALLTRAERYNETLDFIDRLEATGQAIAVRPEPQPGLARLERDPAILNGLYRSGYADAKTLAPRIREALVR
jgi:predicted patatin/cPLA2 family phospholipase